ncbi:MAG: hypothetical protein U9O20_04430 [Patescibacteria group bacterium]|nr:hypothetical protein [Patescibacteria group bacterium]
MKYPKDWFFENNKLSPQKIKNYEIGSDNAPIHFGVYSKNKRLALESEDILYAENDISDDTGKLYIRKNPDSTIDINGLSFDKYDLIDSYGRYEGESAGNAIFVVSPSMENEDFFLIFEWEQNPGAKKLSNNNPEDFLEIVSTIVF